MSILLVGPANSMHVTRWLNYHSKKEVKYSVSLSEYRAEIESNDKNHFRGGTFALPINAFKLLYFVIKQKVKVVHVHSIARYGFLSLAVCLFTNVKIILSAWGSDVTEGKEKFLSRAMIKYLLNRAEIIHVDAAHMKDKCIDISERAKEKIKIIQYGTDLKKFRKIKVVENNDFTIVSIRNHESIYNIDKIIAIFEKIYKTENSNVRLEILGGGQNTPALQSQTNTLSSFSKINFSGFVTQEEMINKINEGNVVISASDRDGGISVSIAEAMACEKVVIASNGPNDENDQWIDHGENGFLFNLENFDELEKLLKECIKNKNSLADIGLKARESIEKNYNFEAEMDKFDKIYKDLVNN